MGVDRSPVSKASHGSRKETIEKAVSARGETNSTDKAENIGETYNLSMNKQSDPQETTSCGECCELVGDEDRGIQCDGCGGWYHAMCVGIDASKYKIMAKIQFMDWNCYKCKKVIFTIKEENSKLKKENVLLTEENGILRERLAAVEQRINELKKEIRDDIMKEVNESVMKVLDDIKDTEEKKNRESNLILYSLEESTKEEAVEREREDRENCHMLFQDGIKINDNSYLIKQVLRLGKRREANAKPRPLLVKLQSPREKWDILKQAKSLKNYRHAKLGKVMVAPDLTPKEQVIDKNLREQLKEKIQSGEQGWFIKSGRLTRRNFIHQSRANAR